MKKQPAPGEAEEIACLLRQVREGGSRESSAAFQALSEKYAPLLSSTVDSFLRDPAFAGIDREDLLQEAAIVLLLAARRFDEGQSKVTFGLYLKICLRNAMISKQRHLRAVLRKKRRAALSEGGDPPDPREEDGPAPFVRPEAEAFAAMFLPSSGEEGDAPGWARAGKTSSPRSGTPKAGSLSAFSFQEASAVRRLAKFFGKAGEGRDGRPSPSLRMLQSELFPLLTPYEREVFRRFYSGQSYESIAEALSRSRKSVDNALLRIRRKWRLLLSSGGGKPSEGEREP